MSSWGDILTEQLGEGILLDQQQPLTPPLTTPPVPGAGSPQEPDQSRAVSAPGRAPGPAARRRWGLSGGLDTRCMGPRDANWREGCLWAITHPYPLRRLGVVT